MTDHCKKCNKVVKQIDGLGYVICKTGHIYSNISNKYLELELANNGYLRIKLVITTGTRKPFTVHRLLWEAFNGPIPKGYIVDHKNKIRTDNRLENLQILTQKENVRKAWKQANKIVVSFVIK